MSLTLDSGTIPYCSPQQYVEICDVRQTGDLVSDAGVPVSPSALLTNPVLAFFLQKASGEVESTCLLANRYGVADLQNMAASGTNSGALLAWLVAQLCYAGIHARRGMIVTVGAKDVEDARKMLLDLREGAMIFGFVETQTSGMAYSRYRTRQEIASARLFSNSPSGSRFLGRAPRWGNNPYNGYGNGYYGGC